MSLMHKFPFQLFQDLLKGAFTMTKYQKGMFRFLFILTVKTKKSDISVDNTHLKKHILYEEKQHKS